MNISVFISSRISKSKTGRSYSTPIVRIATISVGLGLCVMILSISIVTGFQNEIRDKIIGFGGHIQISDFDNNLSAETSPMSRNQDFVINLKSKEAIASIHEFAIKAGIVKTEDEIHGVIFKGIGADYDWHFFEKYILEGKVFAVSNDSSAMTDDVLISQEISKRLNLKTGDTLTSFFINRPGEKNPTVRNPQRAPRKFRISGIYNTGLTEFDEKFLIADIHHIQVLNNWFYDKVSGYELMLRDFSQLDEITQEVDVAVGYQFKVRNVKEINPEIFNWLDYQNVNVAIIIVLMIIVGVITMISTLLIIILERTNFIGTLKALGMSNIMIRKIFLFQAVYIVGKGLLWGNLVGVLLLILQKKFEIVRLDQESYYLSYVPVHFDWIFFAGINFLTLLVCFVAMIFPTYLVSRISPVRAIRFD